MFILDAVLFMYILSQMFLPQDKKQLPLEYYETGKLTFGISDVRSPEYNSLSEAVNLPMQEYSWAKWDMPGYHERLKKSYFILKDAFNEIN